MLRVWLAVPRTRSVLAARRFSQKASLETRIQDPTLPLTDLVAELYSFTKHSDVDKSQSAPAYRRLAAQFDSLQPKDIMTTFLFCQGQLMDREIWGSYCRGAKNCSSFTTSQIGALLDALVHTVNFNYEKKRTQVLTEEEKLVVHLCKLALSKVTDFTSAEIVQILRAGAVADMLPASLATELCAQVLPQAQTLSSREVIPVLVGLAKSGRRANAVKQLYDVVLSDAAPLDPEAIVMALCAMHELSIPEPKLLKRLCEEGLHQVASFNSQQIAAALQYLCLLGVSQDAFAQQLCKAISNEDFTPHGIAVTLHALCRIGEHPTPEVRHLRAQALAKVGDLSVSEISTILNALARIYVPDVPLITSLCDNASKKRKNFNPKTIGIVLSSLAKLKSLAHPLVPELCAMASAKMTQFKAQDLVHMLTVLVDLKEEQHLRKQVLDEMLVKVGETNDEGAVMALAALAKLEAGEEKVLIHGLCVQLMKETHLYSQQIASLLSSLSKLDASSEPLVGYLCKLAPGQMRRFTPREISNMLDAFCKLGINDETLIKALCDVGRPKASYFPAHDVASTLNSLYKLGMQEDAFFERLCTHGATKADKFNAQSIAVCLNVLSKSKVPRSVFGDALVQKLCAVIPRESNAINGQGLVLILSALSYLEVKDEKVLKVLCAEVLKRPSAINIVGIKTIFAALHKLGFYDEPVVEALCDQALKATTFPPFLIVPTLTTLTTSAWKLGPNGTALTQHLWDKANDNSTGLTSGERTALDELKQEIQK